MSSTLTIPPEVIPRLREGAHTQLAHGAEVIQSEAQAHEKTTPPLEERALMDRAWALLDQLGWAGEAPAAASVDLDVHAAALFAALDDILPAMAEQLAETPEADGRKLNREAEYQAVRAFENALRGAAVDRAVDPALVVPAALVGRVREGAYALLAVAAEDIGHSAHAQVAPQPETRPQFDRVWALLGRLGWSADDEGRPLLPLSVEQHGRALLAALEVIVSLLSRWLDETDPADPQKPAKADELWLIRQLHVRTRWAIESTPNPQRR